MEEASRPFPPIRFGIFEVDLQAGELRRSGYKVKLQDQPFQVLEMLLQHPGRVVTREEIQKRLWPADTFVDFELGLNRAMNKLRGALGDNADSPRFIETLPRRGYRFVAHVENGPARSAEPAAATRLQLVQPDAPPAAVPVEDVPVAAAPGWRVRPWIAVGRVLALAVVLYWKPWRVPQKGGDRPAMSFALDVGPDEFSAPAISPDGLRIVFVSKGALAVRRIDQMDPTRLTRLAGTEGALWPFFSPNGRWVAFFTDTKLKKVAIEGGAPITLCDAHVCGGGSWGEDDVIVAALDSSGGLSRVPAAGGKPQPLTEVKKDPLGAVLHRWPQILPGDKGVLFTAFNENWQGSLRIIVPNDNRTRKVVENSTNGLYLASGYLIYNRHGTLFSAPMDVDRKVLKGPETPFVYSVFSAEPHDRADFDVSASGTLVYRRGTASKTLPCWMDPSGKIEPVLAKPGTYSIPRLSPDGAKMAIAVTEEGKQNLWVYDLRRESWGRLTSEDGPEWLPTWTPDGEFLAFQSGDTVAWTRSDGSGKVERLAGVSPHAGPWSFSADGKWLAFWPLHPDSDLWVVSVERTAGALRLGKPQPLLQQAGSDGAPAISPDGRWFAYSSDLSGRFEIYVGPFSPQKKLAGHRWLVSNEGGFCPQWSRNGKELFYTGLDRRVWTAPYTAHGDSFAAEKPRIWSNRQLANIGLFPTFDIAPDGKRVLSLFPADEPGAETHVRVLLNVESELRRSASAQRK